MLTSYMRRALRLLTPTPPQKPVSICVPEWSEPMAEEQNVGCPSDKNITVPTIPTIPTVAFVEPQIHHLSNQKPGL